MVLALLFGFAAGHAFAVSGDEWEGGQGTLTYGSVTYSDPGKGITVYSGTKLNWLYLHDIPANRFYTLSSSGRMFGNPQGAGPAGSGFTYISTNATIRSTTGAWVCGGGKLTIGGVMSGWSYGELTFSSSCRVMRGSQYLFINTGTAGIPLAFKQR
jgi:hypothetical protein